VYKDRHYLQMIYISFSPSPRSKYIGAISLHTSIHAQILTRSQVPAHVRSQAPFPPSFSHPYESSIKTTLFLLPCIIYKCSRNAGAILTKFDMLNSTKLCLTILISL